jgi:RHS repeat-associated protein
VVTYAYDGFGRRFSVVGNDGLNRVQLYTQDGKILQAGPAGGAATRYIYLHNHVIAESGPSGIQYQHTDALGSPVARTNTAGAIVSRTKYEPYGKTAQGATPTIGFTGHVNDADTGLVYMQQRYYDPVAGRFLSIDPVTTDANTGSSFNRYAYANNNPYKYIDPDGRDTEFACFTKERNDALSATIGPTPVNQGWHGEQASSLNEALQFGVGAGAGGLAKGGFAILGALFKVESKVAVGELKLLHSAETIGTRADLAKLSDADLLKSVINPKNGDMVKISTESGKVVDGNSRASELQKRAVDPKSSITPETKIPVEPHTPDKSMY